MNRLVEFGEASAAREAEIAQARHEAALLRAEKEINTLLGDTHFGMTDEIATQVQEALVWTETNTTLNFGEEGGAADVPGALKALLGVIGKQAKQIALLGGQVSGVTEDGTQDFGEVEPEVDADLNDSVVNGLKTLAANFL